MEISDYLKPDNLRTQCGMVISKLNQDNEALSIVASAINDFSKDDEISSSAYNALKQRLNDYLEIISSITAANQIDYNDIETLGSLIGDETLDGKKIISGIDKSENDMNKNNNLADSYSGMAAGESNSIVANWYWCLSGFYRNLAESDYKCYLKWKEKANKYDEIEAATNGLFLNSCAVRDAAYDGLAVLGYAFKDDEFITDMDATWRKELNEALEKDVNLTLVKTITKKLFEEGYSVYDLENMSIADCEVVLCSIVSEIGPCLPTLKSEEKITILLSPNISLEYAVESKTKGTCDLETDIEGNKIKFKDFGTYFENENIVKYMGGYTYDGEASIEVNGQKFALTPISFKDGKTSFSVTTKVDNSSYGIRIAGDSYETDYEASVKTELSEEQGDVTSKITLISSRTTADEVVPIDVIEPETTEYSLFDINFSDDDVVDNAMTGVTDIGVFSIIIGIALTPETCGLSLALCVI